MRGPWVALLAGAGLLAGCSDPDGRPLSAAERREVSQRYADTVRAITPLLDSLCASNHEALVAELADSLYRERVADLERQAKRLGR